MFALRAAPEGRDGVCQVPQRAGDDSADDGNYKLTAEIPGSGHTQEQAPESFYFSSTDPVTPKAMALSLSKPESSLLVCAESG